MGDAEDGPAVVKGILKASTLGAAKPSAAGDGDGPRVVLKGKAPLHPTNALQDAVHTTFHAFHDRVSGVFANLGTGLSLANSGGAPGGSKDQRPPAWMPGNTSVVRRGRDVGSGDLEDSDDDDREDDTNATRGGGEVSGSDDDEDPNKASGSGATRTRKPFALDLDCLASDEETDDDGGKQLALGASVGRCAVVDREDEFDYFDALADGERSVSIATAGSGSKRDAHAVYVPPGKRPRTNLNTQREVNWDGNVREVRRTPREGAAPRRAARPGVRKNNSWVPDHVRNPHKYDVYVLDTPLVIGGSGGGGERGSHQTEIRAGTAAAGDGETKEQTNEVPVSSRKVETETATATETAEKPPLDIPAPTFRAPESSGTTARLNAKRRREERVGVFGDAEGATYTKKSEIEEQKSKAVLCFEVGETEGAFLDAETKTKKSDHGGSSPGRENPVLFRRGKKTTQRAFRKKTSE